MSWKPVIDGLYKEADVSGYVPYTGATADVSLGDHDIQVKKGVFDNFFENPIEDGRHYDVSNGLTLANGWEDNGDPATWLGFFESTGEGELLFSAPVALLPGESTGGEDGVFWSTSPVSGSHYQYIIFQVRLSIDRLSKFALYSYLNNFPNQAGLNPTHPSYKVYLYNGASWEYKTTWAVGFGQEYPAMAASFEDLSGYVDPNRYFYILVISDGPVTNNYWKFDYIELGTSESYYFGGNAQSNFNRASVSSSGLLGASDFRAFKAKEAEITEGTSSQYWRGDKTWQTLDTAAISGLSTALAAKGGLADTQTWSGVNTLAANGQALKLKHSGMSDGDTEYVSFYDNTTEGMRISMPATSAGNTYGFKVTTKSFSSFLPFLSWSGDYDEEGGLVITPWTKFEYNVDVQGDLAVSGMFHLNSISIGTTFNDLAVNIAGVGMFAGTSAQSYGGSWASTYSISTGLITDGFIYFASASAPQNGDYRFGIISGGVLKAQKRVAGAWTDYTMP